MTAPKPALDGWLLPPQAILLTGPTASGKSAVALDLAARLHAEIVSADSMQVYRGLDIGTAKPSAAQRTQVPHHLVDVVPPDQPFDVAQFLTQARGIVSDILRRKRIPLICGGTPFYLKALLEGIGDAPPADPHLREVLEQTSLEELLHELNAKDPAAYQSIDRQNPRRVIRALEVIRLTGRPFSAQKALWNPAPAPVPGSRAFVLERSPEDLRARVDARVDQMFAMGLIEETRALADQGLRQNPTACQAIGYRQVLEYLEGKRSLDETRQLVKHRTWHLARRQRTWFRNHLALISVPVPPEEDPATTARRLDPLLASFSRKG